MISNYIKLVIRALGQNKFFTSISLFGISFTLAILMLIISMLETEVDTNPALSERDKMVLVPNLQLKKIFYDTIYSYDSTMYNGEIVIDFRYKLYEQGSSNSNNELAHWFLEEHLDDIPNAVNQTFFNRNQVNNSKVELKAVYADHRFGEVFDFKFIDGFGFNETAVKNEELVAVITDDLADKYFGRRDKVLGKNIEKNGRNYSVIGVIKPAGIMLLSLDIVVPYTHDYIDSQIRDENSFGSYMAMYIGDESSDVELIKEDIKFINSNTEVPAPAREYFDITEFKPYGFHEACAGQILDMNNAEQSLNIMTWVMYALIGFLILLPTLNLINLNVGRFMERNSEIGVRKAFGVDRTTILVQFILENIVQTFLGGLIGLGLAILGIDLINDTNLIGDIVLKVNYRFFGYSLIICLLFGLLLGILHAYRMSKMHIVSALKQNKL